MAIEEAIDYFQQKHRCFPDVCGCRDCGAERVAIQALREKQERENPEPLTLDELGCMHGEPVYVVDLPPFSERDWKILDKDRPIEWDLQDVNFEDGDSYPTYDYGKTWLAYRSRPKEGMNQ